MSDYVYDVPLLRSLQQIFSDKFTLEQVAKSYLEYDCYSLMKRFGPLLHLWCMRFEAKHNYFKDLAHHVKCFKNIPKTMAQNSNPDTPLLQGGTVVGPGMLYNFRYSLCNMQTFS